MTDTQLFAFVILPILMTVGGKITVMVHSRNFERRHRHPTMCAGD